MITIKLMHIFRANLFASTNVCVELLFDLCRFLIRNKVHKRRHLTGKIYHFLNISEGGLIVQDVCIRLHEQNIISALQIDHQRFCPTVTKIIVCLIHRVRSDDNFLGNYLRKLISDRIRIVLITTTKTNEIALDDSIDTRQPVKTSVKNCCNFALVELIDLSMIVSDTNLFLVEHCLGSYKELTVGRVNTPHDCRGTVHLDGQFARIHEPIQDIKVTREDGIFGVFEVCVFHDLSMARKRGDRNPPCATFSTVTQKVWIQQVGIVRLNL